MLKFNFTNETKEKISASAFQKLVDKFSKILKLRIEKALLNRDGEIDLVLVSDQTMQAMNLEYRGKNEPTDVMSFAYLEVTEYEKEEGDVIVGDIFISADTAKKQAKEKGHDLKHELAVLFTHGMLHLFGFDHQNNKEEAEMEGWAGKILG